MRELFLFSPNYNESYLELQLYPSFEGSAYFQLIWDTKQFRWMEITFPMPLRYYNLLDKEVKRKLLKEKESSFYYRLRTGTGEFAQISCLVAQIEALTIKPRLKPLGMMLDGTTYMLALGIADARAEYHWHICPKEWNGLEELAEAVQQQIGQFQNQNIALWQQLPGMNELPDLADN